MLNERKNILGELWQRWRQGTRRPSGSRPVQTTAVTVRIDDSQGWGSLTNRPHEYDQGKLQELYEDALTAWRKNPIAWRIIAITTDYTVGDNLRIGSPNRSLAKFIYTFWNHAENRMDLRLESLSDELARSGDLFLVLFRNQVDGMSYLRLVTKDRITKIEAAPDDWEKELVYYEKQNSGEDRRWLAPLHPDAEGADAIMMHYAVNRPAGALLGESDLTTMLPWLQRYSRMLEDRVRLHWAVRSFLWIVSVPSNLVAAKREQYRNPPEAGSVVIKDESETWQAVNPDLKGMDARYDMQSVRQMIDAGSGYPPHWRGEAGDANLATATAMQGPTERHLLRRQQYFIFILNDLLYHAYDRARQLGRVRPLPTTDYDKLFNAVIPEISRWDNESLARAAREMATAMTMMNQQLPGQSELFLKIILRMILRFAGEPQNDETLEQILTQVKENPNPLTNTPLTNDSPPSSSQGDEEEEDK